MTGLSDAEWKLMNLLWESSPRTVMGLVAAFRDTTGWTKHTVITMLSRLEAKGAVRHEEGGRAKRYFPAVPREDAVRSETENLISKVGGLGLVMSALVDSHALTEADIAELSAILEKAGGDGR